MAASLRSVSSEIAADFSVRILPASFLAAASSLSALLTALRFAAEASFFKVALAAFFFFIAVDNCLARRFDSLNNFFLVFVVSAIAAVVNAAVSFKVAMASSTDFSDLVLEIKALVFFFAAMEKSLLCDKGRILTFPIM